MKKGTFRVTAAILALVTALSLAACGKEDGTSSGENAFVPVALTAVAVEEQERAEDGSLLLETAVDAVEFTGGGPGAAAKMTADYAALFNERAAAQKSEYIDATREVIELGLDFGGNSFYFQTAGVIRSDETLFALRVTTDCYVAGAAHGSYFTEALCYDPSTGERITLADIGCEGADPTDELALLLAAEYMENHAYPDGFADNLATATEYISSMLQDDIYQWYIGDRFVLISNAYDLASYAYGPFELSLSPAELEGVVDAKWFAEPAPLPNTRIYTDESDFDDFDMVYMVGNYGYEMNFVWFDQDVTNVYLTEAVFSEDGESFVCGTTLDAHDVLSRDEALLLDIMIPEGMPNTALFADIDGQTYTWLIGYNGRDGGISFVPTDLVRAD